MKAILVGLGSAGFGWYKRLKARGLLAAVVETDELLREKLTGDSTPFYTSLQSALEKEQADFLVNITPPHVHTEINLAAFNSRLPVLCEKPISFDYAESMQIVERAMKEGIPFMIAENYRRWPYVRKMKQILDMGEIGEVSSIHIGFYRYHNVQRQYRVHLLRDIGVHHFDMVRYLTGKEGHRIQAQLYSPIGGWGDEGIFLNASAHIEMENGIRVDYSASIAARGIETTWAGNWRIEGTEGALELINNEIIATRNGVVEHMKDFHDVPAPDTLDDFLAGLINGQGFETSGKDYLRTEALVHYAIESSKEEQAVDIILPTLEGDAKI